MSGYIGHMTKLATMSIVSFRNKRLIILKHGFEHQGLKGYTILIDDEPSLTLTNVTEMSNVAMFFLCAYILGPDIK